MLLKSSTLKKYRNGEKRMTINFEKDQVEVFDKTKNINKLADKIKELQAHQQQLEIQEDAIKAAYAELAKGQGLEPTQKLKVEPMTLKALVRERLEAGKEMPTELFNIYVGNKTTIKRKQ